MEKRSKNYIIEKLKKLVIMLETPKALRARRAGCYCELYSLVYRLYAMGLRPNTILDVGANRGMFSKCAHFVFPNAAIYAFEPLKDCYEELFKLRSIISQFECYNVALGEKSGVTFIYRSSYDYSSSLLEMSDLHKEAFPCTAEERLEKIQIKTLDEILTIKRLERPILMKIDVQGYEKFVLEGSCKTLEITDYILCEMSFRVLYKNQSLFHNVYALLMELGFRFTGSLAELQHPVTTEVLQIDGLFIR